MGIRGELFSTRLLLPNRTYFLNVKENRMGDFYLNIVESKNKESGGFDRQSVIVFADDLPAFLAEFDKSLKVMEKAVRDKKRGSDRPRGEAKPLGAEKQRSGARPRSSGKPYGGDKPRRSDKPHSSDKPRSGNKRVVVKKRPQ